MHRPQTQGWSRIDSLTLGLITLVAALIRLHRLRVPGGIFFDEFYVIDACNFIYGSASLCGAEGEIGLSHPPLGKWLIGFGIRALGYSPQGWRTASLVAGTLTVSLTYLLGRRLLISTALASIAAGLLAFDLLHFVFSRTAMLDVFVTLFVVAAVLFAVYDRDRSRSLRGRRGWRSTWLARRAWRIAAGVAVGAAGASKWSGLFIFPALLALTLMWEAQARRDDGQGYALRRAIIEEGPSAVLAFGLIPLVVYAATFGGRLDGSLLAWPWSPDSWLRVLWERQRLMYRSLVGLEGVHPYGSAAWSWILLKRPVSLFFTERPDGSYASIIAVGNPIVWWPGALALVYTGMRWAQSPAVHSADGVIVLAFIATYVPWLFGVPGREQYFLFYLLPSVPFLTLALASASRRIMTSLSGKAIAAAFAAATLVSFAFFHPILSARPLSYSEWRSRMVFRYCGQEAEANEPGVEKLRPTNVPGPPPRGWCWI